MGVLNFSDAILSDNTYGVALQCLTGTTMLNINGTPVNSLASGVNCITFWKGTFPTTNEQNVFINSTRTSDALLRFSLSGAFTRAGKRIIANFGSSAFGTVLGSGTITWFNFGNTDSNVNRPMVFGTVGAIGSGADLELPKIQVVNNDLWLCPNLYFDVNNKASAA